MKNLHHINLVIALGFSALVLSVSADEKHDHNKPSHSSAQIQKDWGIAGNATAKTRTIKVEIDKSLRFVPSSIAVKKGETLRFVVQNSSEVPHEFVLGTQQENQQHAEAMLKNPNMKHSEPHQASIAAGKTGEVVWTFNRSGEFEFACMVPGHYLLGMKGKIEVAGVR